MDDGFRLHAAKEKMRIIRSRKGFDSSSGGVPSPIFPDGTTLSLFIPDKLSRINTNHQGGLKYIDDSEPDSPPSELVEFVFGRKRFIDYKGLYMISKTGSQMTLTEGWLRVTAKSQNGRLVGGQFILWGVPFYLSLLPTPITWEGAVLMRHGIKHWFQTRDDKGRNVKSHLVTFTYPK